MSKSPNDQFILIIPDGFGLASEVFARNYNRRNDWNNVLGSDTIQIGSTRTRSPDSWVTDSAASATAYSCAIKVPSSAYSSLFELLFRIPRLITVPLVLMKMETLAAQFSKLQRPQDITPVLLSRPGSWLVYVLKMFTYIKPLVSMQLLQRSPPTYMTVTMSQLSQHNLSVELYSDQLLIFSSEAVQNFSFPTPRKVPADLIT